MAKKRKAARKTRKPAARRTAKLKGRKVAKPKARRAKPRRAKAKRKGLLAGAFDAVREATSMRRRMDRNTFEGQ